MYSFFSLFSCASLIVCHYLVFVFISICLCLCLSLSLQVSCSCVFGKLRPSVVFGYDCCASMQTAPFLFHSLSLSCLIVNVCVRVCSVSVCLSFILSVSVPLSRSQRSNFFEKKKKPEARRYEWLDCCAFSLSLSVSARICLSVCSACISCVSPSQR